MCEQVQKIDKSKIKVLLISIGDECLLEEELNSITYEWTLEVIEEYLRNHPDLVENWIPTLDFCDEYMMSLENVIKKQKKRVLRCKKRLEEEQQLNQDEKSDESFEFDIAIELEEEPKVQVLKKRKS
jgi:hypothetical protein